MNSTLPILSAVVTDRGLSEKRPHNEDSFLHLAEIGIFAVADGVGGAQAGEVASQMAVEILGEAFSNLRPGVDAEETMRSALNKANSSIYRMALELPQLARMATTIVALHIDGDIATIGHVGDSRLYKVDSNGVLSRETADHSVVAEEVRAGRMTEEEAEYHPSKNVISRALGAEPEVHPDLKTVMVAPGSTFLLCSDGITRHITDQEIQGVLTFGVDPDGICKFLRDTCYERGAEDNLTALVVRLGPGSADHHPVAAVPERVAAETSRLTEVPFEIDDEPTASLPRPLETSAAPAPVPTSFEVTADVTRRSTMETPTAETVKESTSPVEPADDYRTQPGDEWIDRDQKATNPLMRIITYLLLIAGGAVIGIAVFYMIAPKPVDTGGPALTQMRTANIPLSTFEENRRNVDKDPATYLQRYASSPQDCEDYYLVGRTYLLTADYDKARAAFTAAREHISDADPANRQVLMADISIGLVITNDRTVQTMLQKEMPAASTSAPMTANSSNSVSSPTPSR